METPVNQERHTETPLFKSSYLLKGRTKKNKINEGINWDSNVLHSLITQKRGAARDYGKGEGVVVDLLPGVDSSGASIPSGSMEP